MATPDGWVNNLLRGYIPRLLDDVLYGVLSSDDTSPVAARARPDADRVATAIVAFTDAVHVLFNRTARLLAAPVGDRQSEGTYKYAEELATKLEHYIRAAWDRADTAKASKESELATARVQLGLIQGQIDRLTQELAEDHDP